MRSDLQQLTYRHLCVENLLPGDIVLTRSPRLLGRIIRWGTRAFGETPTIFNHAGMVVDKMGTLVEALSLVEMHHICLHYGGSKDQIAIFRITDLTDDERERVAAGMVNSVGQRYGYGKIVLHMLQGVLGKFGIRTPVFTRFAFIDKLPICSYKVTIEYAKIGVNFGIDAECASPDDIGDYLYAHESPSIKVRTLACIPKWSYGGTQPRQRCQGLSEK